MFKLSILKQCTAKCKISSLWTCCNLLPITVSLFRDATWGVKGWDIFHVSFICYCCGSKPVATAVTYMKYAATSFPTSQHRRHLQGTAASFITREGFKFVFSHNCCNIDIYERCFRILHHPWTVVHLIQRKQNMMESLKSSSLIHHLVFFVNLSGMGDFDMVKCKLDALKHNYVRHDVQWIINQCSN